MIYPELKTATHIIVDRKSSSVELPLEFTLMKSILKLVKENSVGNLYIYWHDLRCARNIGRY